MRMMQMDNSLFDDIMKELKRAKRKHPNWPQHVAAQAGIVVEEVGELMQACLQNKYEKEKKTSKEHCDDMRNEAIQVIVTALRFIDHIDYPKEAVPEFHNHKTLLENE